LDSWDAWDSSDSCRENDTLCDALLFEQALEPKAAGFLTTEKMERRRMEASIEWKRRREFQSSTELLSIDSQKSRS
jgi:hypothetical protein